MIPVCPRTSSNHGFTLVEMLASLVIVTILTALVLTGITVALRQQQALTFEAQSQTLANTIDVAMTEPAHFIQASSGVQRVWRTTLRDVDVEDVTIVTHSLEDGVTGIALKDGNNTYYDLVNKGTYGDCTISALDSKTGILPQSPMEGDDEAKKYPEQVVLAFTITSLHDSTLSKSFTYTYVPTHATKVID